MPTPAAERITCPRCHAPLQAPNAECAACLLALAVEDVDDAPPLDDARDERSQSAPAAPTPEELAADFPQLELLERVGAGGMGAVYRARHLALEREVAVKILSSALASDTRFAERFQREARALAKLDHPAIVRVHDFGRAGQRWYLIMEFVRGASLRRKLSSGPLPPAEALAIVMQLADALEFAHARGVVHRDLKPENVLLDERGVARLADFGLAKLLGDPLDPGRTETGVTLGTPPYMAPEQLTQPQDVDHRADLYALGVLFYELLTGKLPLGRFDLPSQRAGVPTQYDAAILKLLEREPQQRFQSAREAADALAGLTGAEAQVEPAARDDDETDDREKGPQASARTTPQARVLIAAGVTVLASFCPWFTVNLPRRGSTWGDMWALHISVPEPSIEDVRFTVFSWNAWTTLFEVQWPLWLPAVIALFAALDSMLAARGNWRPHPRWCLAVCSLALALVVQTLREAGSPHTTYGIGSLASAGALLVLVWHYLALQLASWLPAFVKVDGPRVVRKSSRRRTPTRPSKTR